MKYVQRLIPILCMLLLLVGCKNTDVRKTYQASEENGIIWTYSEMGDGTFRCNDTVINTDWNCRADCRTQR